MMEAANPFVMSVCVYQITEFYLCEVCSRKEYLGFEHHNLM